MCAAQCEHTLGRVVRGCTQEYCILVPRGRARNQALCWNQQAECAIGVRPHIGDERDRRDRIGQLGCDHCPVRGVAAKWRGRTLPYDQCILKQASPCNAHKAVLANAVAGGHGLVVARVIEEAKRAVFTVRDHDGPVGEPVYAANEVKR